MALGPEACRRLACDGALTRILVTRHPTGHHPNDDDAHGQDASGHHPGGHHGHEPGGHRSHDDCGGEGGLADRLQAVAALLPPVLGAPQPTLDLGRASRTVSPAQRSALAVRDGGCVFPDCQRPLAWCEAHHLWHWVDGGPTDLANLALVCRAHHRAVHEGGWQLTRGPDGHLKVSRPHRSHPPHRRHRVPA